MDEDEKNENEAPDYSEMTLGELKEAHKVASAKVDEAQAAHDKTDEDGKAVGKTVKNAQALREAIAERNAIAEAHNALLAEQEKLAETEDKPLDEAKAEGDADANADADGEKADDEPKADADGEKKDGEKTDVDAAADDIADTDPAGGAGADSTEEGASSEEESTPALVTAALRFGSEVQVGQQLETITDLGTVLRAAMDRPTDGRTSAFSVELYGDDPTGIAAEKTIYQNGQALGMFAENGSIARAAFCELTEINTDVPSCVRGGRPVADFLNDTPMTRGQVRVPQAIGLQNIATDWTYCESAPGAGDDDQSQVDVTNDATWKQCATVDCPTYEDFCLESVYWCLEVPKDIDMSAPEHVEQWIRGAAAGADRRGDQKLMQQLFDRAFANGRSYSYGAHISAIPDVYRALVEVLLTVAMDGRLDLGQYDAIVPQGMVEWVGIDNWNRSDCCDDSPAQAFSAAGVGTVAVTPDWRLAGANPFPDFGVPAATTPIPFPIPSRTFDVFLVNRNEARRGTGRNIEVGLTSDFRDFGQYRRNSRGIFVEYDETMVFFGCDPVIHLQLTLCPNGGRVGLIDPTTVCV